MRKWKTFKARADALREGQEFAHNKKLYVCLYVGLTLVRAREVVPFGKRKLSDGVYEFAAGETVDIVGREQ